MRELLINITSSSSSPFPHSSSHLQKPKLYLPKPSKSSFLLSHPPTLNFYANLASKFLQTGRLHHFLMITETLAASPPSDQSHFFAAISPVISGLLREGKHRTVLEILAQVEKFGISPLSLFDGSTRDLLKGECSRMVGDGKLEEFVEAMEVLSGYGVFVKDFVEPLDIIRMCVERRDPDMAVRYACTLPHAHILFSSILHEFGKKRDLASALVVFDASKLKLDGPNMYACRTIIDICGLCGDYLRSRCIFEELLAQEIVPNIYVFNSLMNVNAHDLSYTLHAYKKMQILCVPADLATYNILLKACCLAGRVDLAQDIYKEVKHVASSGTFKLDVITYSTIIKVFADAKMWQMTLKIKEDMHMDGVSPNIITWSSLISAFAKVGLVEQAIQVFEEMLLAGCEPNSQCCNILLYACVESCQFDRAFRFFNSWMKRGFEKGNADTKASFGLKGSAGNREIKVAMFRPTVATYNIMMKACGTDYYRAKALLDEMKVAGLSPNHISWSIVIDICGSSKNIKGAIQAFKTMRDTGIDPDVIAYTTAIKACVQNKNLKIAFLLFEEMKRYQIQPNLVTYNTLLRARTKYGTLHEVQQCLAIYQDMRNAGYNANDYFLKELIEEWCEGVIKDGNQIQYPIGLGKSTCTHKPQNVLEKIAVQLQKDIAECLAIDLRGLSKVEARIVVLAVLRMIKESYSLGHLIEGDMVIILGVKEGVSAANTNNEVRNAVIKVLRDELGLKVLTDTEIGVVRPDLQNSSGLDMVDKIHAKKNYKEFEFLARRPSDLERLLVSRRSLYDWLQKRVGTQNDVRISN